jgi:hypothetical protein
VRSVTGARVNSLARRERAGPVCIAFALCLTMCGAEAQKPAAAPTAAYPREEDSAAGAPPPPPPPASPAGGEAAPPTTMTMALGALDRAEAELRSSASDCASACRALSSMERATAVLCSLTAQGDEAPRCDEARRVLLAARDRVRLACGGCPGGPSVDRDAPIPSTR